MKALVFLAILVTPTIALAQQVAVPCVQIPGTVNQPASCQPVSSTNPLPVVTK